MSIITAKSESFTIYLTKGEQNEIKHATIYTRQRPLVSFTGDLSELHTFDGVTMLNACGELTQLVGLYYHGDIYPLSRKTLTDLVVKMVHLALDKGRAFRRNIYQFKLQKAGEEQIDTVFDDLGAMFKYDTGNITLCSDLTVKTTGSDKSYLAKQCVVIYHAVQARPKQLVKLPKKQRLVGQDPSRAPFFEWQS
jgi:hypothetical protein